MPVDNGCPATQHHHITRYQVSATTTDQTFTKSFWLLFVAIGIDGAKAKPQKLILKVQYVRTGFPYTS